MRLIDADELKKVVNEDINRCYMLGCGSVGPLSNFLDQIDAQPTVPTTVIIQCKYFLPPDKYKALAAEIAEQIAAGGALTLSPALEKVTEVPRTGKLQIVAEVNYGEEKQ